MGRLVEMNITLYGIPNCDTVKKARTHLDEIGISYIFHDYRKDGITPEKIKSWLKSVPLEKLLNKASTTYKELSDKEKEAVVNKAKAIKIMVKNPTIIKRPVLEKDSEVVLAVGFKPEWYEEALK